MFKFVRKHSQPIRDDPLTDSLFLQRAWKYKPSQPIGDHPLWPCPLRVVSNFVRHSYDYIILYYIRLYYVILYIFDYILLYYIVLY